jgi:hypothetical protein
MAPWSEREAANEIVLAGERSDGGVVREGELGGARDQWTNGPMVGERSNGGDRLGWRKERLEVVREGGRGGAMEGERRICGQREE